MLPSRTHPPLASRPAIARPLARAMAGLLVALLTATVPASPARAQDTPARRLSSIVGVAVDEYGKGVDARGRVISQLEYDEAVGFLEDARAVARRLSGARAAAVNATLDTLVAAVAARRPAPAVDALHERFAAALGAEGALELPTTPPDLAQGRALYARNCASCHGARGEGAGATRTGNAVLPAPPIGTDTGARDLSPALMYRVVSVGVAGTPMIGWAERLTPAQRWNVVAYVTALRRTAGAERMGEGLFLQRCASCHGAAGVGDGAFSRALSTAPPPIGSFAWQAERDDAGLARVIHAGVPGTAMPPTRDLSGDDASGIVAYLRAIATRRPTAAATAAADSPDATRAPDAAARRVLALLDTAIVAARMGRTDDAGDRAFDAYIAFEPLETRARARDPGLVATMERHFTTFKSAVRAADVGAAERARNAVEAGLPGVLALARPAASGWSAFWQSFLIILREGFEAILVVGAVVTLLVKTGHRDRLRAVWTGVGLGLAASGATAVVLATVLRALPASREVIEGATMLVAVGVLFSISYWLISRAEAAKWQQYIRDRVNSALARGGGTALTTVAFLAVYREGAETALFYQALLRDGPAVLLPLGLGVVAGAAVLAVVFTLVYRYGVRVPMRPFFNVTGTLLYAMAFTFLGRGIRELQEGDVLPATVSPRLPSVEVLGIYNTWEGVLAQAALLVLAGVALLAAFWPKRSVVLPVASPAAPPADVDAITSAPGAASPAALAARVARLEARLALLAARLEVPTDRADPRLEPAVPTHAPRTRPVTDAHGDGGFAVAGSASPVLTTGVESGHDAAGHAACEVCAARALLAAHGEGAS